MYNLPENLKQLRISRNMTQMQIASVLGMTYQEYQKIESGKTVIRADKLYHICNTLNTSSDGLLGLPNRGMTANVVKYRGALGLRNNIVAAVPKATGRLAIAKASVKGGLKK